MTSRGGEPALIAAGVVYLVVLGWSMTNMSFDIWGALVVIPIYGALGVLGLHAMFRGDLRPIATVMSWGLVVKLGGAMARYWVGFEAYGGGIDAGAYHRFAVHQAGEVWSGDRSVLDAVPTGTGTHFIEQFTAFTYTLTGGSQLAGFVTYSFLAYWGLAFMVKAAAIAVPGLAIRKYAWLCVLCPSVVYWPSSIGKEALMLLGLGVGTYGIAIMLSQRRWFRSLLVIGIGLGFAGLIRPHMAGIWVAAAIPALVLAIVLGARSAAGGEQKRVSRVGLVVVLIITSVGLAVIATATLEFLEPRTDDPESSTLTQILDETARRTGQAGSNFVPPSITSPTDWPYAVARTLSRPLPIEAHGIAQLVSAAELMALFGLYIVSWRRVRSLPKAIVTNPYVAFAMTTLFLGGLAFASFANLGVLTRQKSLLFPFLLLVACLPAELRWRKNESPRRNDTARPAAHAGPEPELVPPSADLAHRSSLVLHGRTGGSRTPDDVAVDDFWAN